MSPEASDHGRRMIWSRIPFLATARDAMERVDYGAWISIDDIPDPPIPPHVAAARVLLDDLAAGKPSASWDDAWQAMARNFEDHDWNNWPNHFRAALEQLAKEGE